MFGVTHHKCHESGCHSLKLHITHGLHLPSCTALTHSRPPLHLSHSCHHSLINPDCLTTPAPHSLTHIKAAHKHSPSAKSCFAMQPFLSVSSVYDSPCMTWTVYWTLNLCRLPTLIRSALFTGYPECLPPAPILSLNSDSDSALPTLGLKLVFEFFRSDRFLFVIKLLLDLTTLPLHYRRLRHLRSSGFI